VPPGRYTPQPGSTSGSCRSTRTRTMPTRGGRSCWRVAATSSEATGKRTGELLVTHRGSPTPEVLHQPQLPECEVVAKLRERTFKIPPRLLQESGVSCCSACKVPQYVLAHGYSPLATTAVSKRMSLPGSAPLRRLLGLRLLFSRIIPMSTPAEGGELVEDTRECLQWRVPAFLGHFSPGLGLCFPNRRRCRRGCAGVGEVTE
jgi:hypothetical protein